METMKSKDFFSDKEIEVSEILMDLPNLVGKSENRSLLSVRVPRKKRSVLADKSQEINTPSTPLSLFPRSSTDSDVKSKTSSNPNPMKVAIRSCNQKPYAVDLELELASKKQEQTCCPKWENVGIDLNQEWQMTTIAPQQQEQQQTQSMMIERPLWTDFDVNSLLREHYKRLRAAEARKSRILKMRGKGLKLSLQLSSQVRVL